MLNLNLNTTSSNLGEVVRPPWNGPATAIAGAQFFYSAEYAPDFYDLSGNGNHGTILDNGQPGTSSITNVTTNGLRWEFRATQGGSAKTVRTGYSPPAHSPSDKYGFLAIFKKNTTNVSQNILNSNDGTGRYQLFVNQSNQLVYVRNYGSSNIQMNWGTNPGQTNYKLYNYLYIGDESSTEHRFRVNTSEVATSGTAISTTNQGEFTIGYSGTNVNQYNDFDLVAVGYKEGSYFNPGNVNDLISYYNSIYNYPGF
jgi:hypothetical protein